MKSDGGHVVFFCQVPGEDCCQLRIRCCNGKVDEVDAQLDAQGIDELLLCDDAFINQFFTQPLFGHLLLFQCVLELLMGDNAVGFQQVAKSRVRHNTVSFL